MKTNSKLASSLTAICIIMLSVKPTYAYLDPGTGSMVLQALLAAVAAVSVSIGIFWRRIRLFFERVFNRKIDEGQDSNDS